MKNLYVLVLISFLIAYHSKGQNANQLIRINNVTDVNAMNAISSPIEGSLVYVSSTDDIYYYGNGSWNSIGGGASGDTNDDAWGVTGEDLTSNISRTGKVSIGALNNTTVKLDVNGRTIVRSLPTNYGNGRVLLHSTDGELRTDRYTSPRAATHFTYWKTVCYADNGALITGSYITPGNCSHGHFQFRYQKGQTPLFTLVYHAADQNPASFIYNSSTGIYTVTAPPSCTSPSVQFRIVNDNIEMRATQSPSNITFSIRAEGY